MIRELTSSRMVGLTCAELMAVASCLSKATEGDSVDVFQLSAWAAVIRETSTQLAEGDADAALMHAVVVVLN